MSIISIIIIKKEFIKNFISINSVLERERERERGEGERERERERGRDCALVLK